MINLRDIEHEVYPDGGDLGRGKVIDREEVNSIDTAGYEPFVWNGNGPEFLVYGSSGVPTSKIWRGWIRRDGEKCFLAAVEYYPL
jgi:hypothetical protein